MTAHIAIIGAGLAGCECAMALARRHIAVTLFEMKPQRFSPAHTSEGLAELVCSNSLRSDQPDAAVGVLKQEMRDLGSLVLEAAEATRLPAGKALAVDREAFSRFVTQAIEADQYITLDRREILAVDAEELAEFDGVVVAAGPLASEALSESLGQAMGGEHLYFYDAIAPIITAESIDLDICFRASRYDKGEDEAGDYLNCPMDQAQYLAFRQALLDAEKVPSRDFEKEVHFEGCMPIETLAERGEETLAFGPFKPVGLTDPRTGERPFAVVQLRVENQAGTAYNLVGCQTKLKYGEQERVFRMIPGLENAQFERLGSVHRNTFVNAPRVLKDLEISARPGVYLAGQITGVEGYVESAACGLWLGLALGAKLAKEPLAP
ncbi:MAG: methylenetetrahydrofolate--tRNA-(uracil(54)-C(5))-methyltransferase (FADH(2)-oxidizing) TrmFO, partial [Desulfovibrio sp.]